MKTLISPALFFLLGTNLWAVDAKAVIVLEDDAQVVWVIAASATNLQYKETEVAIDSQRVARSTLLSVLFYEPDLFKEAQSLFENRDYAGAKLKFQECAEAFKKIEEIPGNYGTLAGFYALECARIQEDLEELAQMLEAYRGQASLVRESQKNQFEVYIAWDAVRTKSWPRLAGLTTEMLAQKRWTGTQLAQIYYCRGLAFEGVNKPTQALNAFNGAFTADFTASSALTKKAAIACLRIIQNHDEVKLAMQLFGTEDEDANSNGYALLQEGVAMCELWTKALGAGQALPSEYKGLLKFKAKTN
jgi:hypothetical protein